ncbi:MAG: MgtC/SapB family protein [Rhodothalassiaceae bacterium]
MTEQFPALPFWQMVLRLAAAVVLVTALGLEREMKQKSAGLRTLALVSLGACGFVLAVIQGPAILPVPVSGTEYDPTGLIAAIAGGIGFLGAGAIFTAGGDVKGLTTGATIWIAGAIGTACGVGQLALAAVVSLLTVTVLVGFRWIERVLTGQDQA